MTLREAIPLEDFERMEKGLPPLPKKKEIRPDPEPPMVENRIEFESIPLDKAVRLTRVREHSQRNKDGVIFIGYDIELELKDSRPLQGWVDEGTLIKLIPLIRERTDQAILHSVGY